MDMIKTLLVASILLLVSVQINAAIITHVDYTHDTETDIVTGAGLEWLRWDRTIGMSWNEANVQKNTIEGGGWELATPVQINSLFDNFGFGLSWDASGSPYQNVRVPLEAGNGTGPDSIFISMFGYTFRPGWYHGNQYADWNPIASTAIYGPDLLPDGSFYYAGLRTFENVSGKWGVLHYTVNMSQSIDTTDWGDPYRGVALVRSVPEPSVLALMLTGIFGLGIARRRIRG